MSLSTPIASARPIAALAAAMFGALLAGSRPLPAQACSLTNATTWCAHQDSSSVLGTAQEDDHFAGALAFGDFNGDGFDDLAVGAPGEDDGAGFVHVFYSNGFVLALTGQQLFGQDDLPGADEGAEDGDEFGAALAAGDFNHDGRDDLAVGSPGEDVPERDANDCSVLGSICEDAGGVHVINGSGTGLQLGSSQFYTTDELSPFGAGPDNGARLGASLAVGRLNTDAIDDLAVGEPETPAVLSPSKGRVHVAFGADGGLNAGDVPVSFNASTEEECDGSGEDDGLGTALAAGSFESDLGEELAIGAPGCNLGAATATGAAYHIIDIAFTPITVQREQADYASAGNGVDDHFGAAVAVGDFDHDGLDDLAAAAPNKNHGAGNPNDSGRVYVAYSNDGAQGPDPADGPDIIGEDEWAGDTPGEGEHFGSALAAGDVDGDGFDDLLAGAPGEGSFDVGRIYLKRGSAGGLTQTNNALFTQTFLGGSNGTDDHLGNVIALGDVDGDGSLEIALGVPDKDVGTSPDAGMVYVTRAFGRSLFRDGFEAGNKAAWSASTP
jgi:hypothetical protein